MANHKPVKSDPQRHLIYTWDDQHHNASRANLSTKLFYTLIRDICFRYDVRRPRAGKLPRAWKAFTAVTDTENGALWFDPQYCSARILAHELAHWILFKRGIGAPYHGPIFAGLYIRLLDEMRVMPIVASVACAEALKIEYVDPRKVSPGGLKTLALQLHSAGRLR